MSEPLLRRIDQLPLALLVAVALVSMAIWWFVAGGASGRLVNIERASPLGYNHLVDVNSAEWPELAQLPEIGETLARRIVETRQTTGPYETPEDLLRVNGIGDKTLDKVRRYLAPLPGEAVAAGRWQPQRETPTN